MGLDTMQFAKKNIRFIAEMGPLLLFFICNHFYGLIPATGVLVVTGTIGTIALYHVEKTVSPILIFATLILGILGTATYLTNDTIFIKMKPTIVSGSLGVILTTGYFLKKGLIKHIMGHAFAMKDEAWLKLSLMWGLFFLASATANEIAWRNLSEDDWVTFKVFGLSGASFVFIICIMPFLLKHAENLDTIKEESPQKAEEKSTEE